MLFYIITLYGVEYKQTHLDKPSFVKVPDLWVNIPIKTGGTSYLCIIKSHI